MGGTELEGGHIGETLAVHTLLFDLLEKKFDSVNDGCLEQGEFSR